MNQRVTFPLTLQNHETGEVEVYDSDQDLMGSLEDFDSQDPDWAQWSVTDALGRSVRLYVRIWENSLKYSLS